MGNRTRPPGPVRRRLAPAGAGALALATCALAVLFICPHPSSARALPSAAPSRARPSTALYYETRTAAGLLAISQVSLVGAPPERTGRGAAQLALNGSHVQRRFVGLPQEQGGGVADGLAADRGHLYFSRCPDDAIGRARPAGGRVDGRWLDIHSDQGPFQIAADEAHIYWTWGGVDGSPAYTGRANADRSHLDRRFLADSIYPLALADRG
jgi:hypothetical protein